MQSTGSALLPGARNDSGAYAPTPLVIFLPPNNRPRQTNPPILTSPKLATYLAHLTVLPRPLGGAATAELIASPLPATTAVSRLPPSVGQPTTYGRGASFNPNSVAATFAAATSLSTNPPVIAAPPAAPVPAPCFFLVSDAGHRVLAWVSGTHAPNSDWAGS